MRNISFNFVFIYIVVAYTIGCCDSYQNMAYSETNRQQNIKEDASTMFRRLLGKEGTDTVGKVRVSDYVLKLYTALQEETVTRLYTAPDQNYPTIRTYKGLPLEACGKHGRRFFHFQLGNEKSGVMLAEIVVKITERILNLTEDVNSIGISLLESSCSNTYGNSTITKRMYRNYLIFDISCVLDNLQNTLIMGDFLYGGEEIIQIRRSNEPLLVLYENIAYNPLLAADAAETRDEEGSSTAHALITRQKRNLDFGLSDHSSGGSSTCQRYQWQIDMNIFGFTWIVEPRHYDAGYCKGSCSFPLQVNTTRSTMYSFLKNLWHYQTFFQDDEVPRACCTPVEYYPLSILYVNTRTETDMKVLPDMRVKHCGCR